MMAAPYASATLPIFSGENYDYWSINMKTLFLSLDLWDVVENGVSSAAEGTSEGAFDFTRVRFDEQRDANALFILQQAVSESIFPRLMRASSSQQAWEILEQEFQEVQLFYGENEDALTISRMAQNIYEDAANGDIRIFKDGNIGLRLDELLTPNRNTILHIFITTLNQRESTVHKNFVKEILVLCRSLLWKANVKLETPLHVAARFGHANIVKVLIEHARSDPHNQDPTSGVDVVRYMLRLTTKENDTALHEAVRGDHLAVIKLLIKEDPNFSYSGNDAGESPLYIAVERKFQKSALEILRNCNSPAYDGPCGRTALHAAMVWGNKATITKILANCGPAIITKRDSEGRTPLHLAAYSLANSNNLESTKLLLGKDSAVAYMKDKEGRTALHIAAHRGNSLVMKGILEMCPDCCELVDNKGWNALHFALDGCCSFKTARVILENSSLSNLLNEKDADGNPPLHRHCLSSGLYWKNLMHFSRVDKRAFNKRNLNAGQVALTSAKLSKREMVKIVDQFQSYSRRVFTEEEIEKKIREDVMKDRENMSKVRTKEYLEKAAEAHLVVAALITTVTFAAAITMPGGFVGVGNDPHYYEGSAVLTRNSAFKMFIVADAISLVLSSSAVVTHLLMPFLYKYSESDETRVDFLKLAFKFILMAMGAMLVAFITGAYAVLAHSLGLAVTTAFIGLSFFAIIFWICKLYRKDLGF